MAPKHRSQVLAREERNLPIPLLLFTSYIAAEKSDELIKVFCKELPSIMKSIDNSKKALENKTKTVYKLKEAIALDLKKLELANIVLKELFQEEEVSKLNKDKELEMLHSKISSCEYSKKILKSSLTQYSQSKEVLDSIAVESNQKFIEDEYESVNYFKDVEIEMIEHQKLLTKHKYDVMIREKKLENLLNELQILKNVNYKLSHSINNIVQHQMQEQRNKLQIKRWAYDTCLKIGLYRENMPHTEDFLKLLNEVHEFIIFARKIMLRLEHPTN